MKTLDENTQLALEWINEHIPYVIKDGILDDWLDVVHTDLNEDQHLEIGDCAIDIARDLSRYIEIVRLINANNQESLSRACELAEELK